MAEERRTSPQEIGVGRPEMPECYGVPKGGEGMLSWSRVVERMSVARNYWLATVRSDGRPHSVPVWGCGWRIGSTSAAEEHEEGTKPGGEPERGGAFGERRERDDRRRSRAGGDRFPRCRSLSMTPTRPNTASVTGRRFGCSSRAWPARGAAFPRTRPAGTSGGGRAGRNTTELRDSGPCRRWRARLPG